MNTGNGAGAVVEVAAGVIYGNGRLLCCERPAGKAGAGCWEFPGGKLEAGETPAAALARELREELALEVLILDEMYRIETVSASGKRLILHFIRAQAKRGCEPVACENQRFRWLASEELDTVPWLPADQELIDFLKQ